jgi:hypothetical protein
MINNKKKKQPEKFKKVEILNFFPFLLFLCQNGNSYIETPCIFLIGIQRKLKNKKIKSDS